MKRFLLLLAAFFTAVLPLTAGGKSEQQYKEVQGKENWHYDYDISKLEPGRYNLLIQAIDKAGNISVAGPFNINVDPKSDIPVVTINSPIQGMRTTGKINVVGTAVDDDGVSQVEIQLGKDGEWVKVKGEKYWSHYLDISGLSDGEYQISARATDLNGLVGPLSTVSFHLDQYRPIVNVNSHAVGVILKGAVRLSGEIDEFNGAQELYFSPGGQDQYQRLPFEDKKDGRHFSFALDVNTSSLKDGPQIYWFKAVNRLGNEGRQAFLFFVDNTPPEVRVLEPEPKEASAGLVYMTGMTVEEVGLQSLLWEIPADSGRAAQKGEIPLIPGNPYWTLKLDFSNQAGPERLIRFTALDKTGNRGTTDFRILLDREADRPVIAVDSPAAGASVEEGFSVRGWIRDDDGVKSLSYALKGGESGTVETEGVFDLPLHPKTAGAQELTLTALDANGLESLPVKLAFTFKPTAPLIVLDEVLSNRTRLPFHLGHYLRGDKEQSLTGRVLSTDRLNQLQISLAGGKKDNLSLKAGSPGEYSFSIPLDSKILPSGRVDLDLSVKDAYGAEAALKTFLFNLTNDLNAEASNFTITDLRYTEEKKILLTKESPFVALFNEITNSPNIKVEFNPPTADFAVSSEQKNGDYHLLTVTPVTEGNTSSGPVKLKVTNTDTSKTYESEELTFLYQGFQPSIVVESPASGVWLSQSLALKGRAIDPLGFDAVEYSLDGGASWIAVPLPPVENPNKFSSADGRSLFRVQSLAKKDYQEFDTSLDITGLADGDRRILIRARDKAGVEASTSVAFYKSSTAPVIALVTPPAETAANGLTTIVGNWSAGAPLSSIEYSDDGQSFTSLGGEAQFQVNIDFSKYKTLPEKFFFRGTDRAGNTALLTQKFTVDLEVDKPKINIQIPAEKEVLRNDFFISGLALDDDGVQEIWYKVDGQAFARTGGDNVNSFSVPVKLSEITDSDHTVEVYAIDLNGNKSEVIKRNFTVSRSGPTSKLARPDLNITQKGKVILEGSSEDPNGVDAVFLSFDNGNTFLRMKGSDAWSYYLDTSLLADGLYTLFIRAFDKTGAFGDYTVLFSLDNTVPTIALVKPRDGEEISENISLEGRSEDNLNLKTLKYTFKPLDEKTAILAGDMPVTGGFTENIDITNLAAGWYNLSLEATDDAGNLNYLARNIQIKQKLQADSIEVLFPAQGQKISGPFNIEGQYFSKKPTERVTLYINGKVFTTVPVTEYGYFSTSITTEEMRGLVPAEALLPGKSTPLSIKIESGNETGPKILSSDRLCEYQMEGPWIRIVSHRIGDFVTQRPYLTGRVGYFTQPNNPILLEGETPPPPPLYGQNQLSAEEIYKRPMNLEISLDNGLTFDNLDTWEARFEKDETPEKGTRDWKYRIQTQDLPAGDLTILLKATYPDGSQATNRQILVVDTSKPEIALLNPKEDGRFNNTIGLLGTAEDENGLSAVKVVIRKGDKSSYQVPGFIQGMFLDTSALGATLAAGGLGLTFFDQAVKLEGLVGYTPEGRFSGTVFGAKLLASIINLPFGFFFGPDWDFFSMSGAVGANFSYFSVVGSSKPGESTGSVLGAMLLQFEFARFAFRDWTFFNSFSFYGEYSFWFISSDVQAGLVSSPTIGFRLGLL